MDRIGEVVDLCLAELRALKQTPVPESELRRAKDHLKGSLMLSLENTASRMSHLARQEIYFDRQFGLDETLEGVERVNEAQKRLLLDRVTERFGEDLTGLRMAVWGLSFKPETDDMREAPSLTVLGAMDGCRRRADDGGSGRLKSGGEL